MVIQQEIPLSLIEIFILRIGRIVGFLTPIVFALALLVFFIGLVRFIARSDNEIERLRGQRVMVWGVTALFVMTSIWGIIAFVGKNLLIEQGGTSRAPQVELPSLKR